MGLWSKLTGGQPADTRTGRSLAARVRTSRDISRMDAAGRKLLGDNGLCPTKKRRR